MTPALTGVLALGLDVNSGAYNLEGVAARKEGLMPMMSAIALKRDPQSIDFNRLFWDGILTSI